MLVLLGTIAIASGGVSVAHAFPSPIASAHALSVAATPATTEASTRSAKLRQNKITRSDPHAPAAQPPSTPEPASPAVAESSALPPAAAGATLVATTIPVSCLADDQQVRISLPWPAPKLYAIGRDGHTVILSLPSSVHLDVPPLSTTEHRCGQSVSVEIADNDHTMRIHLPAGMEARDAQLADALVIDMFRVPAPASPVNPDRTGEPSWPPPMAAIPAMTASSIAEPMAEATRSPAVAPLQFAWRTPVAAALFRRGSNVWLVFDQPSQQDGNALSHNRNELQIEPLPHPRATILRLRLADGLTPHLERNGNAWILRFDAGADLPPDASIPAHPDQETDGTTRLLLPVAEPAEPLAFTDPEVGDSLIIVPTRTLGSGIARGYDLAQLHLLPTAQGIVVQPLVDDLRVRTFPEGVDISRARGLNLSPVSDTARAVTSLVTATAGSRVIPADVWPASTPTDFPHTFADLNLALSRAADAERPRALLNLARFYVAAGLGAEALGTLDQRQAARPADADGPQEQLLRSIARWLAGRTDATNEDLNARGVVGDTDEGRLWRALVGASEVDPAMLPAWSTIVAGYPPMLRRVAGLALLNAAVNAGASAVAGRMLAGLRALITDGYANAWLDYQEGRLKLAAGDEDGAVAAWDKVVDGAAGDAAAHAAFDRVQLLRHQQKMTLQDAIDTLDRLRATWRGDELQFRTMRELGQLQSEAGDSLAALQTWREAVSLFPTNPESPVLTRQMEDVFEHAIVDATPVPPWKTVALFEEFNELLPADERGRAIMAAYADRLVAADLRPQAETVIEKLLVSAPNDVEKAKTALRLAQLQLADGKPEAALASAATADKAALPSDRQPTRHRVVARALLALGQPEKAIATIAGDTSADADAIRLAVQRRDGSWDAAAQTIERIEEAKTADPAQQNKQFLDRAAALTLANDQNGLAELRAEPDRPAAATPAGAAIDLMTRPSPPISPRKDAIAATVSEAEELASAAKRAAAAPAAPPISGPPATGSADNAPGH